MSLCENRKICDMKTRIGSWSLAVVLLAAMSLSAMAQSDVKVNKVLRAQKMSGKMYLRSTDARLPQTVAMFDHEEDVTNMPQAVRDFLGSYEEALRRIDNGEDPAAVLSMDKNATLEDSVGPILGAIEFDQDEPYNNKCPIINNGRAVTGCVATAMAEIMAYWRYPSVGKGSTTYTGSKGQQTYNYADHPFDWNNILDTYRPGLYTAVQGNAIAELMLECGASVNMNYNESGSGANSKGVAPAFVNYFGYDQSINYLHDATDEIIGTVWVMLLKREFDARRPVYYSGGSQIDGHAFVLDGYKTVGDAVYFHVNWGWNGHYNGWYLISNLRPHEGEINFSGYSNTMVMNIFPPGMGIKNSGEDGAFKVDMDASVYTILGNKIPASSMQRGMIYIQNGRKFVW